MTTPVQEQLNRVVELHSEIDAVLFYDMKNGMPLVSSNFETGRGSNVTKLLFHAQDAGEAIGHFAQLRGVQHAIDSFGSSAELGKLRYTIFNLSRGLLQVHFRQFDILTALCFVSTNNQSMALFLNQCDRSAEKIFALYQQEVNAM